MLTHPNRETAGETFPTSPMGLSSYGTPERIRVCHFVSGDLWAGAEVMAWHLMEALCNLGQIDLSIIICNDGELYDKLLSEGRNIFFLDEKRFSPIDIFFRLKKYLELYRPHVLHCHRYKENILGYLAGRFVCRPVFVSTQHGMPEYFQGFQHIKNKFFSTCNVGIQKKFNAVVAVSSDIQQALITEHRVPSQIISTIRNGVPLPEQLVTGPQNTHFVIGSAGRFVPVKDYDLMVGLATKVIQQAPELRFRLAGEGPLREQLQSSISSNNLVEYFTLTGALREMGSFYLGLNLYINTSLHEGIPMSILEAMSYGVPVVACDVGGIREIIDDGVDGFLVSSRDPQALAEKCLLLYQDRVLWKRMSAAARRKIETSFSDVFMGEQYLALYHRILQQKKIFLP